MARREGVRRLAVAQDRNDLPFARRGGTGICGTSGHDNAVRLWRHDRQEPGALWLGKLWGSVGMTLEVGSFPPNKFGLYDMHGNVWELVEDNWHSNYEDSPPIDGSVWEGGGDTGVRALRGGSSQSPATFLRSAHRHTAPACAVCRFRSIGFRVARTVILTS